LFEGLETRRKLGLYALYAMVLFILGVIGSSYMRGPQPFPMSQESSSVAAPQLFTPQPEPDSAPSQRSKQTGQVSINNGTFAELDTLPNIGPVKAQAIIDYRSRIGGFKSLEELKAVKGIGDKTYAKLLPLIRL
jgi:comEA protein